MTLQYGYEGQDNIEEAVKALPETDRIEHAALLALIEAEGERISNALDAFETKTGQKIAVHGYWIDDAYSDNLEKDIAELSKRDLALVPPVNCHVGEYEGQPRYYHNYSSLYSGSDYCYPCVDKLTDRIVDLRLERLTAEYEAKIATDPECNDDRPTKDDLDIFVSRSIGDQDGCATCDLCGATLDAGLTAHGLRSEMEHYLDRTDGLLVPEIGEHFEQSVPDWLYSIKNMLEAFAYQPAIALAEAHQLYAFIQDTRVQAIIEEIERRNLD